MKHPDFPQWCANSKQKEQMKKPQTFKFDPKLIDKLKKEAKKVRLPFNRYVENLLYTHPKRVEQS
jgi:hypothetical protein